MTNPFSTNPEEPNAQQPQSQQPDARQLYGSGDPVPQNEQGGPNTPGDRDGLNEPQTQPPSFQPEYGQNPDTAPFQSEAGAPAENPFNPSPASPVNPAYEPQGDSALYGQPAQPEYGQNNPYAAPSQPAGYAPQPQQENGAGYGEQPYGYGTPATAQNGQNGQTAYGQTPQNPYAQPVQPAYGQPYEQPYEQYGQSQNPYVQPQPGYDYTQSGYGQPGYGQPGYSQPGYGYPAPQNPGWNVMAVVGFALSFFVAIAGLILSIIGLRQIKRTGEKGRGLAIAGIVISVVQMLFVIVIIVIFAAAAAAGAFDATYHDSYGHGYDYEDTDYGYYDDAEATSAADSAAARVRAAVPGSEAARTAAIDAIIADTYAAL
ncbi:DUF4190 domain-containing protein [Bifidobacterium rousetti]|uniref:DUF4190 domain-containing protein n=1 Tax=Bifidobacterium rousetti TaxID=2045439 RepID=UPI001CC2A7E2|nr:DUF4190 domain-containing protein [Bifidobacterium rousetti]